MTNVLAVCTLFVLGVSLAHSDTGLIIPSGKSGPDVSVLSLESMDVKIVIDNGQATVSLTEIFHNSTWAALEGVYNLALPNGAAVSDFAVWDGLTRIPGVILERKRAGELYEQIRNESIDPALLESAEVSENNAPGQARRSTAFTVKIVPIPAMGYKRIEASYRQTVPVTQLASDFIFPLVASAEHPVHAQTLKINVEIRSSLPITAFENVQNRYWLKTLKQTPRQMTAATTLHDVPLDKDLDLKYTLSNDPAPRVTAYHEADLLQPGYFEVSALLQARQAATTGNLRPRTVIVLFDTSLSMQWDKLERSWQALEAVLRSLTPKDSFNVLVFNSDVSAFAETPRSATSGDLAKALDFVRLSALRGGTRLDRAFEAAFAQCTPNSYVALLSDGESSEGVISPNKLSAAIDRAWQTVPAGRRPHLYTLAIGDDANISLMRRIASHGGVFEQVNTTEPLEYKLNNLVREIGEAPLQPVTITINPQANTRNVYRQESNDFPGSKASWIGEYLKPAHIQVAVSSGNGPRAQTQSTVAELPAFATEHSYVPVTWARARVDALLEKIDREGEDKTSIDEIIRLSRKYHFVTPYTSFLAAPRSLLRPRLIRPGDPVLRVRTDRSIMSVIALFPFGLTKPLRYLQQEDMWQTRFLAPADLADGAYTVRLILRDRDGHVFNERKTFLLSSHAPIVRVALESQRVHAGSTIAIQVEASATTRTITARLYGAPPLFLHWNESDRSNTGQLMIPGSLPPGRYSIHVTAEDIAHNVSHKEAPLEVLP